MRSHGHLRLPDGARCRVLAVTVIAGRRRFPCVSTSVGGQGGLRMEESRRVSTNPTIDGE